MVHIVADSNSTTAIIPATLLTTLRVLGFEYINAASSRLLGPVPSFAPDDQCMITSLSAQDIVPSKFLTASFSLQISIFQAIQNLTAVTYFSLASLVGWTMGQYNATLKLTAILLLSGLNATDIVIQKYSHIYM